MQKQYDNNMSGAIFVNKDKTEKAGEGKDTSKWADRRGSCEIDGVEYWISGWLKTSKAGEPFLSLRFEAKDEAQRIVDKQAAERASSNPTGKAQYARAAVSHVNEDEAPF